MSAGERLGRTHACSPGSHSGSRRGLATFFNTLWYSSQNPAPVMADQNNSACDERKEQFMIAWPILSSWIAANFEAMAVKRLSRRLLMTVLKMWGQAASVLPPPLISESDTDDLSFIRRPLPEDDDSSSDDDSLSDSRSVSARFEQSIDQPGLRQMWLLRSHIMSNATWASAERSSMPASSFCRYGFIHLH